MIENVWTEARMEVLRRLHAAGDSFETIAKAMQLTKNQVVGKAHRLGLALRPSPIRSIAPAATPRRIPEEGPTGCRFPLWKHEERPTHEYCNAAPRAPGEPYCAAHRAICWTTLPPRLHRAPRAIAPDAVERAVARNVKSLFGAAVIGR